ncbi:MAG: hypothetical protein NTV82_02670 [Candidatus Aminicenantes bacterium]|nr:hypothetical protein [Candidatus Aminicenantes bacterium]
MEKIRKLAEAIWYNKERIVLGVMVCILLWHVYTIFNPPTEVKPQQFSTPRKENIEQVIKEIAAPPDPPEERPVAQWEGIYTPNPFWALSGGTSTTSSTTTAAADISLIQIQQGRGGKYRARLKTNVMGWYDEGDSFESFQLLKINPEDHSVEVRSDRLGKVLTLKAQGN